MEPFKDRWLLAHSPDEPENHLMVYRLNLRDGLWLPQAQGEWTHFAGSSEALSSFSQASTEVILNTFTPTQATGADGRCWLSIHEYPPRAVRHAVLPIHLDVLEELKPYGNMLTVVACDDISQWENSPKLTLVDQHEARHIQQWAEQQHTPTLGRMQWLWLTLRLYVQAPAAHQRTRFSWVVLLALMLGAFQWSVNTSFEQTQTTLQTTMRQMAPTPAAKTSPEPDWKTWQQQIKRFGEGERSNVQHLQFMWGTDTNVYTLADLNKPRKRLPKGCQAITEESIHIVCSLPTSKEGKPNE